MEAYIHYQNFKDFEISHVEMETKKIIIKGIHPNIFESFIVIQSLQHFKSAFGRSCHF